MIICYSLETSRAESSTHFHNSALLISFTNQSSFVGGTLALHPMYADHDTCTLWQVGHDARIHAFDLVTLEEKFTLSPPLSSNNIVEGPSHCFQRHQQSSYMAIGTIDSRVFIWDLDRGIIVMTLQLSSPCYRCIFDIHLSSLFIHTQSTHIHQYDIQSGNEMKSFKVSKKSIDVLALNPKVHMMAISARYDSFI